MTANGSGDAPHDGADTAREAWSDVSERFTAWGKVVSQRYREQQTAAGEPTTEETGRKLDEAAREVGDQLNRAFTALGDTLRDERAKADLKDAVRALAGAVSLTVTETTEEIRRRVRSEGSTGDDDIPPAPPAA